MKGLILAGGKGSRLYPTTRIVNKHLLLVYNKPMIMYPIETLKEAGIEDIIITLSKDNPAQFMELLGDGEELGVKLTYIIHGEAKGISHAIYHAKHLIGYDPFVCLLGDNIFCDTLKPYADSFLEDFGKPRVLLKEVEKEEAKRYGVAELGFQERITKVVEKPDDPPSNFIMLGAYFLTKRFFDIYPTLNESNRGEFEITDAINTLLPEVEYDVYNGAWFDCGTFESILKASVYIKGNPILDEWRYNIERTLEELANKR